MDERQNINEISMGGKRPLLDFNRISESKGAGLKENCTLVAAIYVVQLTAADGEYFTKVGITSKYDPEASNPFEGLAARARGFYPYRVTACEVRVGSAEVVKDVEAAMIRKLVGLRMGYTPDVSFNGSKKECFRLAYNKMKKLLDAMWEMG